jgi:hypothetical protein
MGGSQAPALRTLGLAALPVAIMSAGNAVTLGYINLTECPMKY